MTLRRIALLFHVHRPCRSMGRRSQTRDRCHTRENLHSRALITNTPTVSIQAIAGIADGLSRTHLPPRFESGRSELSHFFLKTRKPLTDNPNAPLCLRTTKNEETKCRRENDTRSVEAKRLDELALQSSYESRSRCPDRNASVSPAPLPTSSMILSSMPTPPFPPHPSLSNPFKSPANSSHNDK